MLFAPDAEWALRAAVELVNTATQPDTLTTPDELERWWLTHNYTGRHDRDAAELTALRALRPRLRALLTADRDTAAEQVNAVLSARQALPQLTRHGNLDWHLHIVDPDAPLDQRVLMETAMAVIDLIRSDESSRLAVCADTSCDGLVLDLSRNRSRRFCSTRCANRAAAAAYRARERAAADGYPACRDPSCAKTTLASRPGNARSIGRSELPRPEARRRVRQRSDGAQFVGQGGQHLGRGADYEPGGRRPRSRCRTART